MTISEAPLHGKLTNNTTDGIFNSHGSVRRLREKGNDPEALEFRRRDYAAGGPTGSGVAGTEGFSSPDNLVFDNAGNLWVVTDISSSRLNKANEYAYHKNNALFFVPTSGPNKGIGFRFANGPVECELTRRVRPGGELHQLVARGQPHDRGQRVGAEAVDRRDHARVRRLRSGWARLRKSATLRSLISS